jgi:4-hydroxybenzoate polyprenyltransferase
MYGKQQYDYIGDSKVDIPIFKNARQSFLVNGSASLKNKVKSVSNNVIFLDSESQIFLESIKAIRIYQWVKNILLFIPLITSHLFFTTHLISQAVLGFFSFSFVASAGYLLNDLFDVNADRIHPRKKMRPFAAGSLSIIYGISLAISLLLLGGFIASLISFSFVLILLVYFVISFTYSLYFKKIILYDVFVLAILYTIRVFAGGIATEIPISFWLIAFSTFLFLSLAFVKRFAELMKSNEVLDLVDRGRAYFSGDLMLLQIMGIVSGFLSVIVFSLYIDSNEVKQLYTSPRILWGTSLLFLFWISRVWVETNRGKMTDDPIVYAIKDKTSYFIFIGIAIIMFIAK